MTDETVLDGNQQDPGEKGSQPQSSTPTGQPSADVTALQQRIDALEKLYRGVKKSEDTINARVEKRVNALTSDIERIVELAKAGKSQSEIEERLVLDEIIRERKGNGLPAIPEGTGTSGQGPVDVTDIAKQLNLDVNDKDIATALASGSVVNLMKVAMSKAQAPSPGPEDNPLLTGGGGGPKLSDEQANQKLLNLEALYREPSKNKTKIASLEKELKEAGVLD